MGVGILDVMAEPRIPKISFLVQFQANKKGTKTERLLFGCLVKGESTENYICMYITPALGKKIPPTKKAGGHLVAEQKSHGHRGAN